MRRRTLLGLFLCLIGLPAPVLGTESVFFDGFEIGSACAWSAAPGAPPCCESLIFAETFGSGTAPAWPDGWSEAGAEVALADVVAGRGRLRPSDSGYSLARMAAAGAGSAVEVLFTLEFEELATQGVGFYVRQNGGYLQQTMPHGQGYAVFVEGFRGDGIGLWREIDGAEISIQIVFDEALALADGVPFRVRFRVEQLDSGSTALAARVWPAGSPEPVSWQVEAVDTTAPLQNLAGGFAIDSWSSRTAPAIAAHTLIDEIQIFELCVTPP